VTRGTDPPAYARGSRVTLRAWTHADVDALRPWLEPHHEWHRWDGPYYPRPTSEQADATCAAIRSTIGRVDDDPEPPRRAVIDIGDGLAGIVTWYWESEVSGWRRLGIVLYDPVTWGQGYGAEAFELWVDHIFDVTDDVRLDFATWSGNAGMMGIGRRLGMVEEGRFRQARVVDGHRYDSVVMGVLREEWDSRWPV